MKSPTLLCFVVFLGFLSQAFSATNITLAVRGNIQITNASLSVGTGQVARVFYAQLGGTCSLTVIVTNSSGTDVGIGNYSAGDLTNSPRLPVVVGPASISLNTPPAGASGFCTIELSNPEESFVPSSAVVVPADSGGPVTIILESSTDMVNWTAALPGTYGTTTTNRFFRVRAQRGP